MTPYYSESGITIYCGDAREVLPILPVPDLILTDPPYPDYHVERYGYRDGMIEPLRAINCRQLVFWSAKVEFPLDFTAVHIWWKAQGCASEYERLFERNGQHNFKVFRAPVCHNELQAQWQNDTFTGHPSQKPLRLIRALLEWTGTDFILDPFMGSGSALLAAKQLGRRATGIEIEERWCEVAAKRLAQSVFEFEPLPLAAEQMELVTA